MLLIDIDKRSNMPVYRQVFLRLKELIDTDVLKVGEKLPATRKLAGRLGVNRTTIYKAYEELWALGYIESRQGSYSTVREKEATAVINASERSHLIDWDRFCSPGNTEVLKKYRQSREGEVREVKINFDSLSPDPGLMPVHDFRKCLNRVLADHGASLLQYGEHQGYKPLRKFIAQRMQKHCISVTPEEIMITNGIQHAIDLVLRLISGKGIRIAVESPTYSSIIPLLLQHGVQPVSVPMNNKGMDLSALRVIFEKENPALLYTMPNFQNPTGLTMDQGFREKLLGICEEFKVPVLEDGFEEELKYTGKSIMPVKSMDKSGIVIYSGTFSKILFPGLRIGWIAADKHLTERLVALRNVSDISGSDMIQAALHRYCVSGLYDLHTKKIERIYRRRMHLAIQTANRYFPEHKVTFTRPWGGYTFWVEVKNDHREENEIVKELYKKGVSVTPGNQFFPGKTDFKGFRISIARCTEEEIVEGIRCIGELLSN